MDIRMLDQLSRLVSLTGEQYELTSRVESALEWLALKPEGIAILEEAYALHKKPLKIFVSQRVNSLGYGDHIGNHIVFANPLINDHMNLNGQNGERIRDSLERFLSHELKHATQPDLLIHAQKYIARRQEIMGEHLPSVPLKRYQPRITAVKHDDIALRQVFGVMYDAHVGPVANQLMTDMIQKAANDPIIKDFCDIYETPAIEFENLIMSKYKEEPCRSVDYVKSAIYDEMIKAMDRGAFVEAALASFRVVHWGKNNWRGARDNDQL